MKSVRSKTSSVASASCLNIVKAGHFVIKHTVNKWLFVTITIIITVDFFSPSLSYLTVKWSYVCDPISGCYWQLCKYTFLQRGNSTCAVPLFLSTMCCTADKRLETNVYSIFRQSHMAHCLTFICCFLLVLK